MHLFRSPLNEALLLLLYAITTYAVGKLLFMSLFAVKL